MKINLVKTRLETKYYDLSISFYTALGLKILTQWHDDNDQGAILSPLGTDSTQLEIAYSPTAKTNPAFSLQIEVDNIHQALSALPALAGISGPVKRPWGSLYVYLSDPSGNQVILYQQAPAK
jgi:catechol 2,3-dioxygenase-like lactoylglutathione lyase family enzyme|tara:strand:+ start:1110 stop:1475 length:366 start_codon:yes stop_codon:yes gene_type:complete